jgi:hypothetical protein
MADHDSGTADDGELILAQEPAGTTIAIPSEPAPESSSHPEPTPDEVLAETEQEDPDVGIDGTGVGELP